MSGPILDVVLDRKLAAKLDPELVAEIKGAIGVKLDMATLIERYKDQDFPSTMHVCVCDQEGCDIGHAPIGDGDDPPWGDD